MFKKLSKLFEWKIIAQLFVNNFFNFMVYDFMAGIVIGFIMVIFLSPFIWGLSRFFSLMGAMGERWNHQGTMAVCLFIACVVVLFFVSEKNSRKNILNHICIIFFKTCCKKLVSVIRLGFILFGSALSMLCYFATSPLHVVLIFLNSIQFLFILIAIWTMTYFLNYFVMDRERIL